MLRSKGQEAKSKPRIRGAAGVRDDFLLETSASSLLIEHLTERVFVSPEQVIFHLREGLIFLKCVNPDITSRQPGFESDVFPTRHVVLGGQDRVEFDTPPRADAKKRGLTACAFKPSVSRIVEMSTPCQKSANCHGIYEIKND
jgi:hypothetical protein